MQTRSTFVQIVLEFCTTEVVLQRVIVGSVNDV
jgi:hypothetical protein